MLFRSPVSQTAIRMGGAFSGIALMAAAVTAVAALGLYIASKYGKKAHLAERAAEKFKRSSKTALLVAKRRCCAVLALTLKSGLELEKGIELAEELADNSRIQEYLAKCKDMVDDFRFMYCALAFWLSYRRRGKLSPQCPPCGQETAAASAVIRHTLSLLPDGISICQPEELHWLAAVLTRLLPPSPAEAVIIPPPLDTAAPNVPFLQDAQLRLEIASFLRDCANELAFPQFHTQYEIGRAHV